MRKSALWNTMHENQICLYNANDYGMFMKLKL